MMKYYKNTSAIGLLMLWMAYGNNVFAQASTRPSVVADIVTHHNGIKAGDMKVKAQKSLEKAAFNIPNPDVILESPSGEFYTLGIQQRFEFPTVYGQQKKLAKLETQSAALQQSLTTRDAKLNAEFIYLYASYLQSISALYGNQDSIFSNVSRMSGQLFAEGSVDALTKNYAISKYNLIHNQYTAAKANYAQAIRSLNMLANTDQIRTIDSLSEYQLENVKNTTENSSTIQYASLQKAINEQQLKIDKSKSLPGLMLGYQNQGAKGTPLKYRWQIGLTLPLWYGQYRASQSASKYNIEAAEYQKNQENTNLINQEMTLFSEMSSLQSQLAFYKANGLANANELASNSYRMLDAGKISVIEHLRNLSDAIDVKSEYLRLLYEYNDRVLKLQYLNY